MTTFVSPIGYDSTRVTRPILREGISNGDQIVLLRPVQENDHRRARTAIQDIERTTEEVQPEVSVTTKEITTESYSAAVLACSELLRELSGSVVVNFGGGPRELYLALVTASIAHVDLLDKSLLFSDLDGGVDEIDLPRIVSGIPTPAVETLNAIVFSEAMIGIPDLAAQLGMSKSTVSRHVRQLEESGAVEAEMHGKTKCVQPTFTGLLRSAVEKS